VADSAVFALSGETKVFNRLFATPPVLLLGRVRGDLAKKSGSETLCNHQIQHQPESPPVVPPPIDGTCEVDESEPPPDPQAVKTNADEITNRYDFNFIINKLPC
jgi:hypothetical protein